MEKLAHELWLFLSSVGGDAWAIGSGGVVTVALGIYKLRCRKDLSWAWIVSVAAFAVLLSSFLAWQDQYHLAETRKTHIESLDETNAVLATSLSMYQSEAARQEETLRRLRVDLAAAKGQANLHVTVNTAREPEPNITFAHEIVESPQKDWGAPYAVRLTITADKEVLAPDIEVACTSPIVSFGFAEGATGLIADDPDGKSTWGFTIDPKLTRGRPWTIVLLGEHPIDVRYARKVR